MQRISVAIVYQCAGRYISFWHVYSKAKPDGAVLLEFNIINLYNIFCFVFINDYVLTSTTWGEIYLISWF